MSSDILLTTLVPVVLLTFDAYLIYIALFERDKNSFKYFLYKELLGDEVNSFVLWGATAIAFLLRFIST